MRDNLSGFAFLFWIIGTLGLAFASQDWPSDPRLETWIGQIGVDEGWEHFRDRFGGDEVAVCRFESSEPFDAADLSWIMERSERLERLPALRAVVDPIRMPGASYPPTVEELREAAERPVVRALGLLPSMASTYSIDIILLLELEAGLDQRSHLFGILEDVRDQAPLKGLRFLHAGHPAIAIALDAESKRIETIFAPLLTILSLVATAFFLRSIVLATHAVLPAIAASSAARFGLKLAGFTSDLILVSVGPLVFVLLLAAMLHLIVTFRRRLRVVGDPEVAAREALALKFKVALLGAVTTAVGFGVFAWSGLRSVALLGGATAITVLLFVPLSYLVTAWFLGRLETKHPVVQAARFVDRRRLWRRVAVLSFRNRMFVRVATLLLLGLGAWYGAHLRSETNALHYFPDHSGLKRDFMELERSGAPLSSLELLVGREEFAPEGARMATALSEVEGVQGVFGPEAVLEEIARADVPALGRGAIERAALFAAGRVDDDGEWLRWTVRFPTGEAEETRDLVERIRARALTELGERGLDGPRLHVTGSLPRLLEMQSLLIGTLGRSLVLTGIASAFLFFLFATRKPRELFATLLANLTPIAAIGVAAHLLDFPLDGATVMVAAVALGLAVDNTFHLLHAANPSRPSPPGVLPAFSRVGEAAAASSFGLTLGFAALAFSGFAPTARFGILCAVGASIGLVADLVVLPAFWIKSEQS